MAPAGLHTLLSLWYPTARCPANHSPQPLSFQPRYFFSLSGCLHWWGPDCVAWQSQAQWWAEKHKIMGGLLREALLREKIFFFWYLGRHPRNLHCSSFSRIPRWWAQAANESHRCGFNANQYCANIHLRRRQHGERGSSPTWNARSPVFCSEHGHGKCTRRHAEHTSTSPSSKKCFPKCAGRKGREKKRKKVRMGW